MDITALRSFREVCRQGSISAAAEGLGYTQSALSRQLATLESRMGAQLLSRHARGVRATEAGDILLTHSEVILQRIDRAERDVLTTRDRPSARLRVGTVPSAAAVLLPRALTTFATDQPDVHTGLVEDVTPALLPRLLDGDLDVAVISDCPPGLPAREELAFTSVLDDELLCALPRGHRLDTRGTLGTLDPPAASGAADRGPVDIADLADEGWVEDCAGAASLLAQACARAGFTPRIDIECGSWLSKQAFVASGAGIMLVPRLLLPALRPDLVVRPLQDPPRRSLYAATRRRRRSQVAGTADGSTDTAVRAFLRALCGVAEPITGSQEAVSPTS